MLSVVKATLPDKPFHLTAARLRFGMTLKGYGGILAEGSTFLKYGENGKGIHSRWYPLTLAKRFLNLDFVADRIDFRCEDGLKVMREFAPQKDVIYFIDPPYTAGGKKLASDSTSIVRLIMRNCLRSVSL